ncbi:Nitrogen-fixing NifU-like protein [Rhodopseudomonas palustris HaA2]|uniref:Nitrogen fixation protein NifU n=1 Tax=Rhodopseudomonas palustris (strain HaA2) TaxID=316058 RepID=Q2J1H0_RHOP2|nr:Fe-S cluster assembly protein NifU [Rhodopseudomonas palustris]ABD05690.1 Nitrogen-fixing NifU-like protein [Rhodopseudomonas palustris HaA2]
MLGNLDRLDELVSSPRNAGVLLQANAIGAFGGIRWGDAVKLMLRVDPATDRIEQARFQAFGCSSSIAAASAVTELITGKTLDDAAALGAADIADDLGGLPAARMYCAVMAYEALQTAITSYRGIAALREADAAPSCKCLGVSQMMIERTIRFNRLTSLEQVTHYTKAAGSCSSCFKQVEGLLARVNAEMVEDGLIDAGAAYQLGSTQQRAVDLKPHGAPQPAANIFSGKAAPAHLRAMPKSPPPRPATAQAPVAGTIDALPLTSLVAEALEDLRPHLQRDGGDCELVSVEGNVVYVRLSGNCVGCQLSSVTLSGVQARLADKLGRPLRVVPVS